MENYDVMDSETKKIMATGFSCRVEAKPVRDKLNLEHYGEVKFKEMSDKCHQVHPKTDGPTTRRPKDPLPQFKYVVVRSKTNPKGPSKFRR